MKKNVIFLLVAVATMVAVSCKKPANDPRPGPKPIPVQDSDARTVRLKTVVIDRLPSPYFDFAYNDSGYVTNLNFASNFFTYQVHYVNKRVSKMINTRNNDSLLYSYSNGRVATIKHFSGLDGKPLWHHDFTYYANGALKQMRWWSFHDQNGDSVIHKKITLIYGDDGNLAEFDEYRRNPTTNEAIWTSTVEFSNYDNGVNVDDFYLFKDFFEDVLFLPQVKLQKHNARKILIKGVAVDFTIDCTYQYNANNLPLVKNYVMKQTRGADAGKEFNGREQFSY